MGAPLVPQLALQRLLAERVGPSSPRTPRVSFTPRDGPRGCMLGPRQDVLSAEHESLPRGTLSPRGTRISPRGTPSPRGMLTPRAAALHGRRVLSRGFSEELHPRALHRSDVGAHRRTTED
uniref:Uncharacterized protein n=1 Tax=Diacronema lutheri TaxID=2081491 RepID=A0A7R9UPI2_DIALT